jgi:hypothetical protein
LRRRWRLCVKTPVASWFETRQRVRAKRGPMINSVALLTMRVL